jgi:hypothetical protein
MSSTSSPFGLMPVAQGAGGIIRPVAYTIATGYTSAILQNQPVKIGTDGTIQAAAIGDRFVGTFQGVEYTDTDGKRRVSNKWIASTSATDIVAYVTVDPGITYYIQSNAALSVSDIGKEYDFTTITAGSATTGLSAIMLDVASSATNASLQLLNIAPGADNAWGDTYVIAQVRISEHQLVADIAAF